MIGARSTNSASLRGVGVAVLVLLLVGTVLSISGGATPVVEDDRRGEVGGETSTAPLDTVPELPPESDLRSARRSQANESVPETPDEFLTAFDDLSGRDSYANYTEFQTIREVGVSTVQVGDFDEATRREAETVYLLLVAFDEAYEHARAGDDEASLDAAERAAEHVRSLRSMGASYAVLADLALDRFFSSRADELFAEAESQERTTDRLDRLELANRAIRRTDDTETTSQIATQIEELSIELERDRERIDDAISNADTFVGDCEDCTTPRAALESEGIGVLALYAASLDRQSDLDESADLAAGHGLADREERIATLDRAIADRQWSLAVSSVALLFVALLAIALCSVVVTLRVVRWQQDTLMAQTGNDVFAEEIRDA